MKKNGVIYILFISLFLLLFGTGACAFQPDNQSSISSSLSSEETTSSMNVTSEAHSSSEQTSIEESISSSEELDSSESSSFFTSEETTSSINVTSEAHSSSEQSNTEESISSSEELDSSESSSCFTSEEPIHIHQDSYYTFTDKHHVSHCECGVVIKEEPHSFGEPYISYDEERKESCLVYSCSVCGYSYQHFHKKTHFIYDEDKHYSICDECDRLVKEEPHSYNAPYRIYDEENNKYYDVYECFCGYSYRQEVYIHEHVYSDEWSYDEDKHMHVAICHPDVSKDEQIHSFEYVGVLVEPTYDSEGIAIYICSVCDYIKYETIPTIEHECISSSYSFNTLGHYHSCDLCHKQMDKFTEHSMVEEVIQEATFDQNGIIRHCCTVCGYCYDELIDPIPHTHSYSEDYHYDDQTHYHECECGDRIDFDWHEFGDEQIIKEPTNLEDGLAIKECSICGYQEKRAIPKYELSYAIGKDGNSYKVTGLNYNEDNYNGPISLYIPSSYNGLPVTAIDREAFSHEKLKEVVLPDTIQRIEYGAFSYAYLEKINLPKSITIIDSYAFAFLKNKCSFDFDLTKDVELRSGCFDASKINNLTTYDNAYYLGNDDNPYSLLLIIKSRSIASCVIHPDCEVIYYAAFASSNIEEIVIPNKVVTIYDSAFSNCQHLTKVTLPNSIYRVGDNVFDKCNLLITNKYDNAQYLGNDDNPYLVLIKEYNNIDLNTYSKELNVHDDCKILADFVYSFEIVNGNSLTVNIPDSVINIGNYSFYNANVKSLSIGKGLDIKNGSMFETCSIDNIVIAEDNPYLTYIDGVIYSKDLSRVLLVRTPNKDVNILDGVKVIANHAFYYDTWLNNVQLPNSVEIIEEGAFTFTVNLFNINIPTSLKIIEDSAFYRCALTYKDLVLPEGLLAIGDYAFQDDTNLYDSIVFPTSLKSIGYHAFDFYPSSNINSITLNSNADFTGAFEGTHLKQIVLGASIDESIASKLSVYYHFDDLQEIEVSSDNPYFHTENGYLVNNDNFIIFVPNSIEGDIVVHANFDGSAFMGKKQITSIVIDNDMDEVPDRAFEGCTYLENISFNNPDIISIGSNAFYGCTRLKTINFASTEKITSLGDGAFYNCASLEELPALDGINYIDQGTFAGCSSLRIINIGKNVYGFHPSAFDGLIKLERINVDEENQRLTSIDGVLYSKDLKELYVVPSSLYSEAHEFFIPDSVTYINSYAFSNCQWLTAISLDVDGVGAYAFSNCKKLENVTISSRLKEISQGMFTNCESIKSIIIPSSITKISPFAFYECTSLKEVIFAQDSQLLEIGDMAFSATGIIDLILPEGLTTIGSAFSNCSSLIIVELPSTLTNVNDYAFSSCDSIREVINHSSYELDPNGDLSICGYILANGKARIIANREESNFVIDGYFIKYLHDEEVELVKYIGDEASIILPNDITTISSRAFNFVPSLVDVTLNEGLKELESNVFSNCYNLVRIRIPSSLEKYNVSIASRCPLAEIINSSSLDFSQEYNVSGTLLNINIINDISDSDITIADGYVYRIKDDEKVLLAYYGKETYVELNNDITALYPYVFFGNSGIETLIIPESITEIPYSGLYLSDVKAIYLPSSLLYVQQNGFNRDLFYDVYYNGTYEQFKNINIATGSYSSEPLYEFLNGQTIHYKE